MMNGYFILSLSSGILLHSQQYFNKTQNNALNKACVSKSTTSASDANSKSSLNTKIRLNSTTAGLGLGLGLEGMDVFQFSSSLFAIYLASHVECT